jgi:hypothetical protein
MSDQARSTMKKVLAAGGLALGLAGLGVLAGAGTAAADGHNIVDDGTWGAPDGAQQRGQSWFPATNEGELVPAIQGEVRWGSFSYDTSSDTPHAFAPTSSSLASSSWPGAGWGVPDN